MRNRAQAAWYRGLRAVARLVPPFVFRAKGLQLVAIPTGRAPAGTPPVDLGWLTEDTVGIVTQLGYEPGQALASLRAGARAAIALDSGRLIACYWFDPHPQQYEGWLRLRIGAGDAVAEVRVAPEYRGRRIAASVRRFASPQLQAVGIERIVGVISGQNHPSRRAANKGSFDLLGSVWYLRILGFTLLRASGSWRFGWWGWGRWLELDVLQADG